MEYASRRQYIICMKITTKRQEAKWLGLWVSVPEAWVLLLLDWISLGHSVLTPKTGISKFITSYRRCDGHISLKDLKHLELYTSVPIVPILNKCVVNVCSGVQNNEQNPLKDRLPRSFSTFLFMGTQRQEEYKFSATLIQKKFCLKNKQIHGWNYTKS